MILTHFLALIGSPSLAVSPAPALLAVASSGPLVGGSRLELARVPALPVRAAPPALAIRER